MRAAIFQSAAMLAAIGAASAQQSPIPVRTLGTVPLFDSASSVAVMPNGRIALFAIDNALYAYNLATGSRTLVARHEPAPPLMPGRPGPPIAFLRLTVSPSGDRIAWHDADERSDQAMRQVWSMPIDSTTGAQAGPATWVHRGHDPRFSPDGQQLVLAGAFDPNRDGRIPDSTRCSTRTTPPDSTCGAAVFVMRVTRDSIWPLVWRGALQISIRHMAYWQHDGRGLIVDRNGLGYFERIVDRIPIGGGAHEQVLVVREVGTRGGEIWESDGRFVLYLPRRAASTNAQTQPSYITASGREGTLPVPANARPVSLISGSSHVFFYVPGASSATILDLDLGTILHD
jgi:hypothetical protein